MNARSARCEEGPSTGVYEFSSPAVKPGHGFMISSLTLEFEYLFGGCPQDGNVSLGIGINGIVVHSRILIDNSSGSASGGHDFNFGFGALNATGRAVEAPIGSTINLLAQNSRSISLKFCSALHLVWFLHLYLRPQVINGVPVATTYARIFAPGKSVADFQVDSVREAFALQCGVSTAAVTFESKPLDGCPSWDLTARRLQATTSTKAQLKIFLESSVETGRVVKDLVAAASSASFSASVGTGLSIINVPYVAFGNLVDSSLSTLTVTSLGHVTEELSPAFDASTFFDEVNVTSLTYTKTPVPVAIRLRAWKWMGKRHTPSTSRPAM